MAEVGRRRRCSWAARGMTVERDKAAGTAVWDSGVAKAERDMAERDNRLLEKGAGVEVGRQKRESKRFLGRVRKTVGERTISLPLLPPFRRSLL